MFPVSSFDPRNFWKLKNGQMAVLPDDRQRPAEELAYSPPGGRIVSDKVVIAMVDLGHPACLQLVDQNMSNTKSSEPFDHLRGRSSRLGNLDDKRFFDLVLEEQPALDPERPRLRDRIDHRVGGELSVDVLDCRVVAYVGAEELLLIDDADGNTDLTLKMAKWEWIEVADQDDEEDGTENCRPALGQPANQALERGAAANSARREQRNEIPSKRGNEGGQEESQERRRCKQPFVSGRLSADQLYQPQRH